MFLILLLQLSEFHVNRMNDCLYCISCVVCYNVEELTSRYDVKLQRVFLTFTSGVFLQKCENLAWEQKSFVEIKPVSIVKYVEIGKFIFAKVVWEHTLGVVGSTYLTLFEIYWGVTVPKIIEIKWHSTKFLQKQKGCSFFWDTLYTNESAANYLILVSRTGGLGTW